MLGHAEEWFYRGLGGINVDFSAAAPRQLVLRPELVGKLSEVRTRYVSAWGPIESNWRRGAKQTDYDFTIPTNAQATVELRTASVDELRIDGAVAGKAPGVISSKMKPGKAESVLGSGRYHISAPNPEGLP